MKTRRFYFLPLLILLFCSCQQEEVNPQVAYSRFDQAVTLQNDITFDHQALPVTAMKGGKGKPGGNPGGNCTQNTYTVRITGDVSDEVTVTNCNLPDANRLVVSTASGPNDELLEININGIAPCFSISITGASTINFDGGTAGSFHLYFRYDDHKYEFVAIGNWDEGNLPQASGDTAVLTLISAEVLKDGKHDKSCLVSPSSFDAVIEITKL